MNNSPIKVYTQTNCYPCKMTIRYLENHHIPFEQLNGPEHIEELKQLGFQQYPVIITPTDSWSGFNIPKLQQL